MLNIFNLFNSWVHYIDSVNRFPVLFMIDSISCCYLVRSLKIKNPMYSLVLTLIMAVTPDSLGSYFMHGTVAVLTDQYLAPIHFLIWIIFNFAPYDILYKTVKRISPILSVFIGFNEGRETVIGIDIANKLYKFWVYKITFAVLFASAKFIIFSFTGRCMLQRLRSPGPIFFETATCAIFYYFFTAQFEFDIKIQIDSTRSFNLKRFLGSISKETARFISIHIAVLLRLIQHWVKDETYSGLWKEFENKFGAFIPYYGKTWILQKRVIISRRRPSLSIHTSSGAFQISD
ncbi:hypothetical protein M9Y10_022941 [Tritrichomonas musculus]|uniref:Uncharacterized protein n=1 Tax=Tritrichomonas musculus TaxID=1915356 RepID=A0ABR2KUB3_9EUKA